jgi:hypothetical protein
MCFLHNNGKITHLKGTNPNWGQVFQGVKNWATGNPNQQSSSHSNMAGSRQGGQAGRMGQPAWQKWMNMGSR